MHPINPAYWNVPQTATIEQIQKFEKIHNVKIPSPYRAFLLSVTNGGSPVETPEFEIQGDSGGSSIRYFFGTEQGYFWLGNMVDEVGVAFPPGSLPISEDGLGNMTFLYEDSPGQWGVYFFDHEIDWVDPDIKKNKKIANSFDEFLDMLTVEPVLPTQTRRQLARPNLLNPTEWKNTVPRPSIETILAYEQRHGQLPDSYKGFIVDVCNGGNPARSMAFPIGESDSSEITAFLGIGNRPVEPSDTILPADGSHPIGSCPFAEDPFGNTLFLYPDEKGNLAVYFREHEEFDEFIDNPRKHKVADSFEDFFASLRESDKFEDDDPRKTTALAPSSDDLVALQLNSTNPLATSQDIQTFTANTQIQLPDVLTEFLTTTVNGIKFDPPRPFCTNTLATRLEKLYGLATSEPELDITRAIIQYSPALRPKSIPIAIDNRGRLYYMTEGYNGVFTATELNKPFDHFAEFSSCIAENLHAFLAAIQPPETQQNTLQTHHKPSPQTNQINLANSHFSDVRRARKSLNSDREETIHVWHHTSEQNVLQLVPRDLHSMEPHEGGAIHWGYGRGGADPQNVKPIYGTTIEWTDPGPPLTEREIQGIAFVTALNFPAEYVQFLSQISNGGIPSPEPGFFIPKLQSASTIAFFYSINDPRPHRDFRTVLAYNTLPKGVIPIGTDPLGNTIIIVPQPNNTFPVCWWEHEEFLTLKDNPSKYLLAPSLNEFLQGLFGIPDFPV